MGNGINAEGNKFLFKTTLTPSQPKTETTETTETTQNTGYVTGYTGINGEQDTSKLSWAQLMGVNITPTEKEEAVFSADDLAALAGLAGVDEPAFDPTAGILAMEEAGFDIMELEAISPNDEVTACTMDNYANGNATRISKDLSAVDEIAQGDPEIADTAAMMFHVIDAMRNIG